MDQETKDHLAEFVRGGELIFDNAERLYQEACILTEHAAFARAWALHQLSNEECGKLDIICSAAWMLVIGKPVDFKELEKTLSKHENKNHANAYFSVVTEEERAAQERGDVAASRAVFEKQKEHLHRMFNNGKNAALYVDFRGGKFSAPKDAVSAVDVEQMAAVNRYFLATVHPYVRLFRRIAIAPETFVELGTMYAEKFMELRAQSPQDLRGALDGALQHLFEHGMDKFQEVIALDTATAAAESPEPKDDPARSR